MKQFFAILFSAMILSVAARVPSGWASAASALAIAIPIRARP